MNRLLEFAQAPPHDRMLDVATGTGHTAFAFAPHVKEVIAADIGRVLKIGGRLIIDDPSVPKDDFVDATLKRLDVPHDPKHVREYRPGKWETMMKDAGLDVRIVEPYAKLRRLSAFTNGVDAWSVAELSALWRL